METTKANVEALVAIRNAGFSDDIKRTIKKPLMAAIKDELGIPQDQRIKVGLTTGKVTVKGGE